MSTDQPVIDRPLAVHLKKDHLWIFVDAYDPKLAETHQREHDIFEWEHTHG